MRVDCTSLYKYISILLLPSNKKTSLHNTSPFLYVPDKMVYLELLLLIFATKTLSRSAADDIQFFLFSERMKFGISCESSADDSHDMSSLIISENTKKKKKKKSSAAVMIGALTSSCSQIELI